jgi:hypothetical protein
MQSDAHDVMPSHVHDRNTGAHGCQPSSRPPAHCTRHPVLDQHTGGVQRWAAQGHDRCVFNHNCMITYMHHRHEFPIQALGFSSFSLFESVYLVMQVSDCHDKQRTNGFSTCPRREYLLISRVMHSVDKRMPDARTFTNEPQALLARVCVFGTDATCCSGARRLKMFTLLFACKHHSSCCLAACGNTPHGAHDSIMHLHQPAQSAPHAPRQGPAAAATYGTHWGEPLPFGDGDHYAAIHEQCHMI